MIKPGDIVISKYGVMHTVATVDEEGWLYFVEGKQISKIPADGWRVIDIEEALENATSVLEYVWTRKGE